MFDSVVNAPSALNARSLKSGAGVSILAHLGVVLALVVIQHFASTKSDTFKNAIVVFPPRPPKGSPIRASAAAAPAAQKPTPKKRNALTPPKVISPLPPEAPPALKPVASADPAVAGLPFIEGSSPDGVDHDGVAHAASGHGPSGSGEDVVVFGAGMTKPTLLSAPEIQYTREAREARVTGMFIARCTLTKLGEVRDCHVIKGLPHMSEPIVSALMNRRYAPVTFQGQAINVSYVFNVKLEMP